MQDLPIYDVPEESLKVEVVEQPDSILKEPIAQVRQGVLGAQSYYNASSILFLFSFFFFFFFEENPERRS